MSIYFLTSSPTGPLDNSRPVDGLDTMNRFTDNLKRVWPQAARCLMIPADPWNYRMNDEMTGYMRRSAEQAGMKAACFDICDMRHPALSEEQLRSYDVIWLGGGHVPTQNAFFVQLDLRSKIAGFQGIIIGISAGTMNCADLVYTQPELDGEAVDPEYRRFFPGLDVTKRMLIPHYQMTKNNWLDGMRLWEEITIPDSIGHQFLVLADGSYLLGADGRETIFGDAWLIDNGQMTQICHTDEQLELT